MFNWIINDSYINLELFNRDEKERMKVEEAKRVMIKVIQLGGEGNPPGIEQEIKSWPYEQVVYAPPRIWMRRASEWDMQANG